MAEFSYSFWLPFPPSVNRIWRRARGRTILSEDYIKWKVNADAAAIEQKISRAPVLGIHRAQVQLSSAFRRNSDVDNRLKVILDWCQRAGLIVNDGQCNGAAIEWSDSIDHDCVVSLSGVVAFSSQWEFARHKAEMARKKPVRKRARSAWAASIR